MGRTNLRESSRVLRRARVRANVRGTDARPRLCVYRSSKHMYVQVISDESRKTLAATSTLAQEFRANGEQKTANIAAAKALGTVIARKCQEQGISQVIFDRNGFLYHGRIRALAEAAREAGLQF